MDSVKSFLRNHKKVVIAVLVPVVLFVLASFVVAAYETWWKTYKDRKAIEAWQESFKKPYREDVHGGKTPEETWGLFLDALRAGDIDLASKYFAVEKQGEWRKILEDTRREMGLENVLISLKTLKFDNFNNDKTKAYYYRDVLNSEDEKRSSPVVFYFNPYTKVWKILVL